MKMLEKWMSAVPLRHVKIWWHWRESRPGPQQFDVPSDPTIYWHVELHQYEPLVDHGQRLQAGSWSKTEHVFSGYDPILAVAARKALKRAKEWEKQV